jgi:phosphoglycolate phosphatase-like HAD superfamily hydrolase
MQPVRGLRHGRGAPAAALVAAFLLCACSAQGPPAGQAEPEKPALPSWNEGVAKRAILEFVQRVTDPSGPDFLPEPERIAVFDNDGTLWAEQPMYFQLAFALDRARALAGDHPEWRERQPYRAILEGDSERLRKMTEAELVELIMETHAGMTTDEFPPIVRDWLEAARHPRFERPYNECVYQPILELLQLLRENGFKTFIVSGGGIDFMRQFTEEAYGIPPEQVIGSMGALRFEMRNGEPALIREPGVFFIDDKAGKPIGIHRHIGRRPVLAFGNSDGDLQMLQYAAGGSGPALMLLVHHDDAEREWAYDRDSAIGHLDKALDEAAARGWTVVSMRNDWNRIFAWEPAAD